MEETKKNHGKRKKGWSHRGRGREREGEIEKEKAGGRDGVRKGERSSIH